MLETHRDADDARIVHERGVVVEVDAALHIVLIGDVACEQRDFKTTVELGVTDAQTAFDLVVGDIFEAVVEEEARLSLVLILK